MRATYIYGAGDVRVVDVADPKLVESTDVLLEITRACICGSDLHPYHSMAVNSAGSSIGHEMIGVVTDVGAEVRTLKPGDFVISPFAISCGVCEFCRAGLQTACEAASGTTPASGSPAHKPKRRECRSLTARW
jgi:threonine dehydrogenase-like Zn-dependent dehydrogenase